jgi:hypothetical protein
MFFLSIIENHRSLATTVFEIVVCRDETGTRIFFLPGPGPGPGPKSFFTRTSTKIFSEQDQDQNVLFGPGP